jgi:hypothetical protein
VEVGCTADVSEEQSAAIIRAGARSVKYMVQTTSLPLKVGNTARFYTVPVPTSGMNINNESPGKFQITSYLKTLHKLGYCSARTDF